MTCSKKLYNEAGAKRRSFGWAATLLLITAIVHGGRANATDYTVSDEASCLSFISAIGATGSYAGQCYLQSGALAATDRLFVTGSASIRTQTNTFTNKGEIVIDSSGLGFYGAGTLLNEGTFTILAADQPRNFAMIINRGVFTTAVDFYNNGTFTNNCRATITGTILNTAVVSVCVDPVYPVSTDDMGCQQAIANAGSKYFAMRHKALTTCRSSLMKGGSIFEDADETIAVLNGRDCANEFATAAKITKARQLVRKGVASKCTDTIVAGLKACDSTASTVDGLVDATGSSGCLIEAVDQNVDELIIDEYGF